MIYGPEAIFLGKIAVDIIFNKDDSSLIPVAISPGGSIFNTALILSRLGVKAGMFSKVGDDLLGRYIKNFLNNENFDRRFIIESPDLKTPLAIAILNKEGSPQYSFYKENWNFNIEFNRFSKLFKNTKVVYLGSSFSYSDESFEISKKFINFSKKKNLTLFYDPNIRLDAIKGDSRIRKRIIEHISRADVVKLSREDLNFIANSACIENSLKNLRKHTQALIVLTLGKKGVISFDRQNKMKKINSFKVKVEDSIGAGDAFGAGLIFKYCRSCSFDEFAANLESALVFASGVSALSCSAHGALNGVKNLKSVNKFIKGNQSGL